MTMEGQDERLAAVAAGRLEVLEAAGLRRELVATERLGPGMVRRGGRVLADFSANDYLGLSLHPAVIAASAAATQAMGVGAGASRLVSGEHGLHAVLEARLAALKGAEACCLFGSGYLANLGAVSGLIGAGDWVLADELCHSSLFAGAVLSGARVRRFRHNDVEQVRTLLRGRPAEGQALVLTERVFSMDGDLGATSELSAVVRAAGGWLLSDDAHGLGVLAADTAPVDVTVGTLSKSAGGYGGFVCAAGSVVALLRNRARSFVYSTGLPPGVAAAAIAALDVMRSEPELGARVMVLARAFAARAGLAVPQSAIVPVVLGEPARVMAAAAALEAEGFLVGAIRPPTVPEGTARLRVTFCAAHAVAEVERLATLVRAL